MKIGYRRRKEIILESVLYMMLIFIHDVNNLHYLYLSMERRNNLLVDVQKPEWDWFTVECALRTL